MADRNKSTRHQLSNATKQSEWLQLVAGGATYQQVAERYKVTKQTVADQVKNAMIGAASRRAEMADLAFELHLERLESLLRAHWPIALNVKVDPDAAAKSSKIILDVLDREAKLFGLNQPDRVDVTIRSRDEVDEEIARLAALMKANTPAGVATPVLDGIISEIAELPAADDRADT